MAFFDEMKHKVTQVGQSAAKSAKDFSEVTRLNSEISDAESRINQLYNRIGYEVYCAYSANPLPEVKELIEQINGLHETIEDRRAQIQAINAASRCPNCGAKIRSDMAFCSNCGAHLVQPEQPKATASAFCSSCGAPLAAGAAFCTGCGARVSAPEPAAAPAPVLVTPAPQPVPQPQPVQASVCPSCGEPLAAGTAFCTGCGARVSAPEPAAPAAAPAPVLVTPAPQPVQASVCPNCGEPLPADATFCINCGTKLG